MLKENLNFAILNKTLSPEEIANLYRLTLGKHYWQVNVSNETKRGSLK